MKVCLKHIEDDAYEVLDCDTGKPIDLGKIKRGKRAPSAYNIFMGSCVKGKSGKITERFKSCAAEYQSKKKT